MADGLVSSSAWRPSSKILELTGRRDSSTLSNLATGAKSSIPHLNAVHSHSPSSPRPLSPPKPKKMNAQAEAHVSQALTGDSTGARSTKLRPRRSGPKATAMASTTMVKISNPASAQL